MMVTIGLLLALAALVAGGYFLYRREKRRPNRGPNDVYPLW